MRSLSQQSLVRRPTLGPAPIKARSQLGVSSGETAGDAESVAGGFLPDEPPPASLEDYGPAGCVPIPAHEQLVPDAHEEDLDRSERRALRRRNYLERGEL